MPRGRCSKMCCRVLHFMNSLQSANVLISQTAIRYKYNMTKIHDKSFCYIYHVLQVKSNRTFRNPRSAFNCSIDISDPVARWLARSLCQRKVPSSNPAVGKNFSFCYSRFALLTTLYPRLQCIY